MAVSEKICWEVLNQARGKSVRYGWIEPGEEKPKGPPIKNAISIGELEKKLVLRYGKQEIEDSLYFLEKRGYLGIHGLGIAVPRMVYSLSEIAIEALERGSFLEEEEKAFSEALFDLKKPGWLGLKINAGEFLRRFKKQRFK